MAATFGSAFYIGGGDVVQTSYIAKTLQEKSYIRPGTTVNPEITFPNAETILYWVKNKASLNQSVKAGGSGKSTVSPGSPQNFAEKKLERKSVHINKTAQINGVIPGVNVATVSADVVNAHVIEDTINSINEMNRDYITVLEGAATASETVAYDASDVYQSILDLRADFISKNKFYGLVPTALFVSPKLMAKLKRENLVLFKDNSPYGTFLDMEIIEAPDLTVDAVMLHATAIISGVAFSAATTFDASYLGYAGGTAYIGELCYANEKTEFGEDYDVITVMTFKA